MRCNAINGLAQLLVPKALTTDSPKADHDGMMRAWTKIVACGTALAARGAPERHSALQGISRSAIRYANDISGADYLEAVGAIHSYGRQMEALFADNDILLSATLLELPAEVGRFTHDRDDYEACRIGEGGVFAYSPYCAAFNASGLGPVALERSGANLLSDLVGIVTCGQRLNHTQNKWPSDRRYCPLRPKSKLSPNDMRTILAAVGVSHVGIEGL
jgi:hypothetical protein